MDKMCELDINILNKYIGATTTQDFETRFEDIRLKLMSPVSYRILNAIRDIEVELPINKNYEDILSEDIEGVREESYKMKDIERELEFVKNELININKNEDDNSILSWIDDSLKL
jgi:hypothetical protein